MSIPAEAAQLIEQLQWTVEDVARCFSMPLWKIGAAPMPAIGNSEMSQRAYYAETLQNLMEGIEVLLDEGLNLPSNYGVEFDLDTLMRMDTPALYQSISEGVRGGWLAPNEGRKKANLPPAEGGDSPLAQQQNYSLEALAKRDAQADPFGTATPAPQLPAPDPEKTSAEFFQKALATFALELA